jgi:hypothetical protein
VANSNVLTEVIPRMLAQGLLTLRQLALMPRYVNRGYESIAGEKGSTIDINISSAITAVAVSPSYVPPDDAGISPTKISITLDQWWEAPFFMTDKDMLEAMNGVVPRQAAEAVKTIANKVDTVLIDKARTSFYNFAGTPGTTPFATDLSEFLAADALLNDAMAPPDDRYMAINSRAKATAMGLRAMQDTSWRGDSRGIIKNEIGEKLGAWWFMDQNLARHTAGTWNDTGTATAAAGATTVPLAAGTGSILAGDKIRFANYATTGETYVVVSATGTAPTTSVVVYPPLVTAVSASAVTVLNTHRMNLLFHRDALALATRPFAGSDPLGLGTFRSAVDPVSGLALRLEVTRQHKRTRWSYDILFGVGAPRPEWGAIIAGE